MKSPAVHIPPRHQSAPKQHPADREIAKAATEIHEGKYVPEVSSNDESILDNLGLSLSAGTGRGVATGEMPTLAEMQFTRAMNELSRHPRVEEALAKMQSEIDARPDSDEAIELSYRMHETLEQQSQAQKWEGQERWQGKENEEMRMGQILSPQEFYARLCKVVGESRVIMSDKAVLSHPGAKSGRVGLYIPNPEYRGDRGNALKDAALAQASRLREEAQHDIVKAKKLRVAGHDAEANRVYHRAGDKIQAATEIHIEQEFDNATAPSEFLRVGVLQWPYGTEWMLMNFNEFGVPTTAKYLGWRTALLTMIRNKVITEQEAHKAFPLGTGPAANWYLKQLQLRRTRGTPVN